ncbi:MAG: hypothetical protein KY439_08360 [Actinobacteria bacterium]|nr:hypothetical protein [Actinomycetota bacterium]
MEAENYLRLRCEEVIAGAQRTCEDGAPPLTDEVADALQDLVDAGLALAGAGLVAASRVEAVLAETEDALAVRGVDWLVTALPDLSALHGCSEAEAPAALERVVSVGRAVPAPDGTRVLASVELWSDRGMLRFVDEGGTDSACELRPAPGPGDGPLVVEMTPGRAVSINLGDAAAVATLAVRTSRAGAGAYLEWLAWQQLAAVRRCPTVAAMNHARSRLRAAAGAFRALGLVGPDRQPAAVGATLHAALVGAGLVETAAGDGPPVPVPPEWARVVQPGSGDRGLRRVVAVAGRLPDSAGGWTVASLEDWADQWRLVATGYPDSPGSVWAAVDDAGCGHGGAPVGHSAIRFDPELRPGWRWVTVSVVDAGEVLSLEIRR